MGSLALLVALLVGLSILAIFAGLLTVLSREDVKERMYNVIQSDLALDTGGGRSEAITPSKSALKRLDQRFHARGFGHQITANLIEADLKITATEYILLVLSLTILGGLLGFVISWQPISALVAATITFFGPGIFVSWRKGKRRREFVGQLVDALTQMVGSLRAGYSTAQSLDTVSKQLPPPAGDEFARVVREIQLGQSLNTALDHMVERIKSDDLTMIVTSINVNQQVGGNLAEILDTVAETIRERVRIKREIQVLTAQQTISGYILSFLPIALGAVLLIINPTYQMRLFTPGPTLCIPIGAGLGILIGFLVMRRIIEIDV